DVVVTQPQRVDVAWALHRSGTPVVYDMYVPSFVERIAQLDAEPMAASLKARLLERDRLEYATALRLGNGFICATERQRDHWLGALGALGRLDLGLLARDSAGRSPIGIVPFGLPNEPATPLSEPGSEGAGAIRGELVPEDSIVLLWTGGIWNWFDPVTLVEGFAEARKVEPRLRLVVLGLQHPEGAWDEQAAGAALRRRADELDLLDDGSLVLVEGWVPYGERHRYLLDADIAVSAHHDSLETRFSFRTRFLDHLWTGLPTLSTEGGDLTDTLAAAGAARTVPDGDAGAWREALVELAADADARAALAAGALELASQYRWGRVVDGLVQQLQLVLAPGAATEFPAVGSQLDRLRALQLLVQVRIQSKGVGSLAGAARDALGSRRATTPA
ncbi:MAG: glycosyltransferase family 1 protein, partial [Thermoleophilia bacterium]|nr:glycosyltransferase family 1 protein [Thermoleophilia bacterium]